MKSNNLRVRIISSSRVLFYAVSEKTIRLDTQCRLDYEKYVRKVEE